MWGITQWPDSFIFSLSSSKTGVCELPLATAKTDDYGHIKIYQQSELNWVFVFGDPIAEWELCLKRDNKLISLWRAHYIGVVPVQSPPHPRNVSP